MSTQKWSDDELDDLFRRSAEEADPPYDPAAWQDMRSRLTKHDYLGLPGWLVVALLLLLPVGGLWYLGRPVAPVVPAPKTVAVLPAGKSAGKPLTDRSGYRKPAPVSAGTPGQSPAPSTAPAPSAAAVNTPIAHPDLGSSIPTTAPAVARVSADKRAWYSSTTPDKLTGTGAHNPSNTPLIYPEKSRPAARSARAVAPQNRRTDTSPKYAAGNNRRPVSATDVLIGWPNGTTRQNAKNSGLGRHLGRLPVLVTRRNPGNARISNGPNDPLIAAVPVSGPLTGNTDDAEEKDNRLSWPTPGLLSARAATWPLLSVPAVDPLPAAERPSVTPSARVRQSPLSVQLVLSPDLSSIGLHNFDRPGSNVGVMVQYRLSNRFSVQTGALLSNKVYTTSASEYVWPIPGGMTVLPESITGKCTMFDIPLNIRYDVWLRPGGEGRGPVRWFVSGGATSYFIDREIYDYTYEYPDNPAIKYRHWDNKAAGQKGGSFGFSNINVSVGYERPIGKRLSWQVEPFMKIPIQQIGYFKVRLLSTGAFLSLRYRL